jgi:hypothetical protein
MRMRREATMKPRNLKMRSETSHIMLRVLAVVAMASTGFVTLVAPPSDKEPAPRDLRPLCDSPLVGHWREQGDAARYRVSFSPSVLFITSFDEAEICEIEVLGHDHQSDSGSLRGVIRLDRVERRNLPHEGRPAMVSYRLRDNVLELSWHDSPELSSRFAKSELIAVREAKSKRPILDLQP